MVDSGCLDDGGGSGSSAARRGQAADQRDQAAGRRDDAGGQRDQAAEQRDLAAEQRDEVAERRDELAERRDETTGPLAAGSERDSLDRSALARREAASDRRSASEDRGAGAGERIQAELDRHTALTDRGASARERESSSIDDLTGVYLRGAGLLELEREIARARRERQPLVLAFIDVDHLKAINDSRGHAAGDRVLLEVASSFKARLRSHDLVIRFGGDEFLCAISGVTMAAAAKRLALVDGALEHAPEHGSVTVGLAQLQAGDSPEDLIARADAALYRERQG